MSVSPAPREYAATVAAAEAACEARDRLSEARGYRCSILATPVPEAPEVVAAAEAEYDRCHRAYLDALRRETAAVERSRTIRACLSSEAARRTYDDRKVA